MNNQTYLKSYHFSVLIPVSSTVIPLDDLPTYQVSAGFGPIKPLAGREKPKGPFKLITSELV